MGLPQFLAYLTRQHPGVVLHALPPACRHLYVDFNGILHTAAARLAAARLPVNDASVVARTLADIRALLDVVAPHGNVLLAVDGVPPFSKVIQQRHRRFVSQWRQRRLPEEARSTWDSNAITPGTAFMARLDAALRAEFAPDARVMVSGSDEPGEGETKIFRCIRTSDDVSATTSATWDLVYGADADLIVRGMLAVSRPACMVPLGIVRDETRGSAFACTVIDVARMAHEVRQLMGNGEAGLLDYVFLMQLVGNDFLPPLTYLNNKQFAIPFLTALYRDNVARPGRTLAALDARGRPWIQWDVFAALLAVIGQQEDGRMRISHERFAGSAPNRAMNASDRLDNLPLFEKRPAAVKVSPAGAGWRKAYYFHLLGFPRHVEQRLEACVPYVQGLAWMLEYYVCLDASTGWCYPHAYSPTALDVSVFLQERLASDAGQTRLAEDVERMRAQAAPPSDATFTLLLVLPPQSAALLPERLRPILADAALGCVAYYPHDFDVFTYLRRYLWECAPRIPHPDVQLLHRRWLRCVKA